MSKLKTTQRGALALALLLVPCGKSVGQNLCREPGGSAVQMWTPAGLASVNPTPISPLLGQTPWDVNAEILAGICIGDIQLEEWTTSCSAGNTVFSLGDGTSACNDAIFVDTDGDIGMGTTTPGVTSDGGENVLLRVTSSLTGDGGMLIENTNAAVGGRTLMELKNFGNTFFDLNNTNAHNWRIRSQNDSHLIFDDRADAGIEFDLSPAGLLLLEGSLRTQGSLIADPDTLTIADSGDANPATATHSPASTILIVTCNDANGCELTLGETGVADGQLLEVINATANALVMKDVAAVQSFPHDVTMVGAGAPGGRQSVSLVYSSTAAEWVPGEQLVPSCADGEILKGTTTATKFVCGSAGSAAFTTLDADYGAEVYAGPLDMGGGIFEPPNGAGAPTSTDCDAGAETGRFYVDTTGGTPTLLCCSGAGGWVACEAGIDAPYDPDTPPASLHSASDEFNGSIGSGWTAAGVDGGPFVSWSHVRDTAQFDNTGGGSGINLEWKTAPSAPFAVAAKLTIFTDGGDRHVGIALLTGGTVASPTSIHLAAVHEVGGGHNVRARRFSNYTTFTANDASDIVAGHDGPIVQYLFVAVDASGNTTISHSPDGVIWEIIHTYTTLTISDIGLYAGPNVVFITHWWRVGTTAAFRGGEVGQ